MMAEETETEELSCEVAKYREQLKQKKRIAVTFVGKEFPSTETYVNALVQAYEEGFFGDMEMAVLAVDSEECDALAEKEGVEELPQTCVYSYGQKVGSVTPTDDDAQIAYKESIAKLIDLSED
jgi:hypothetical protein